MLSSVQCLRGLAALLVVLFHVTMFSRADSLAKTGNMVIGNAGVDIFFVISGFVMWVSTCNVRRSPLEFWRDRIIRIVPLYYIATVVFIIVLFLAQERVVTSSDIFTSLLFIPGINSINNEPVPILGVGWTLNYEMMFYVIFGVALLLPSRFRIGWVAVVFFALVLGRFVLPANAGFLLRITSPLWLEFLAGMLIGVLFVSGALKSSAPIYWAVGVAIMLLGASVLLGLHVFAPGLPRTLAYGVPAASLVLGAIFMEPLFRGRTLAGLRWLGDVSYSLYLAHGIWIFFLRNVDLPLSGPVLFAVALAGAIGVGAASYYVIERPITNYLRLAVRRKTQSEAVPALH